MKTDKVDPYFQMHTQQFAWKSSLGESGKQIQTNPVPFPSSIQTISSKLIHSFCLGSNVWMLVQDRELSEHYWQQVETPHFPHKILMVHMNCFSLIQTAWGILGDRSVSFEQIFYWLKNVRRVYAVLKYGCVYRVYKMILYKQGSFGVLNTAEVETKPNRLHI